MKRNRKVKQPDPAEESTNGSDTEEIPSPQAMKKERAIKRKTRNTKSEELSDSEDTATPKLPLKKEKKKKKKNETVESSDYIQVAGSSFNSDTEEIPSVLKRKVRVKKANIPKIEDNSDSTVTTKSVLPDKLSEITKKRFSRKASSTTEVSDNSDSEEKPQKPKKKGKKVNKKEETISNDSDSDGDDDYEKPDRIKIIERIRHSDDSEEEPDAKKHREDLDHLRRLDPDFYKFLKEHDSKLLNFDDHDGELDDDGDDDDDKREEEDNVHVPGDLHGGSDESDFEDENLTPVAGNITLKMVEQLESELQKSKVHLGTLTKTVKFFNAAVLRVTSVDGTTQGELKVAGASVFNAILNMCVVSLPQSIKKYLGFETSGKDPQKCKHFVKIKSTLIQYLSDLVKLLAAVTADNILIVMLKHLHQLCKYVACFSRISKNVIKRLLPLWSTGQETIRVLSFICILRITRNHEKSLLVPVLRAMFITYIRNCKFVSPTTWPGINFMRRSLVEMFSLDLNSTYPNAFLYVRQLGIHLRNAVVVPNPEHKQAVYNWQYLNALHLWAGVVSRNVHHPGLKTLLYPLVMIISNTIKLVPTAQYYPLRFYLIEILMKMEKKSGQFITIMPFFMDVINKFDINKKHKKASMKPLDFSCIIRLSKSQMNESGFKDAVVERLYALLLQYTASMSHKIIFPDCCIVLILFFREMVDKCNNSNHKKKLKQLLDKIVENNDYMTKKRLTFDGHLAQLSTIIPWEKKIQAQGTPLLTFYENWNKLNKIQKRKNVTKNDELAGVLPLIKRPKIADEAKKKIEPEQKKSGPVDIFPSDSEDDDKLKEEKGEKMASKKKVTKKQKKKPKKVLETPKSGNLEVADSGDVVSEFSW